MIYNGSYVVGEVEGCEEAGQVEIAAYVYDNGTIPYKNIGTYLKQFNHTVEVDTWYNYTIYIEDTQSIFALAYENGTVIETQTIEHRNCTSQTNGNLQALYFGGECEAPQEVTVCYGA